MTVATTSRVFDTFVFAAILAAMLLAAPRLIVYNTSYQVGGTAVSLEAVARDGTRLRLQLPPALDATSDGVRVTAARLRKFARTPAGLALTPTGGRLEWTLAYRVKRALAPEVELARTITTTTANAR